MNFETINQAMDTKEGQDLFKLLSASIDKGYHLSPHLKQAADAQMTYLGSTKHIEVMVWQILNTLKEVK